MICAACGGTGYTQKQGTKVPAVIRCKCQIVQLLGQALESGWKGLSSASGLQDPSPLEVGVGQDCWVTADLESMRQHLRRSVIRHWTQQHQQGRRWRFLMVTDSELMSSWLQNLVRDGETVWDPDVIGLHQSFMSLASITLPPDLLVIRLGVKAAPNRAMPDVLLEALLERQHAGKPTWVWDQLANPLSEGHRCYSEAVMEHVKGFKRITLGKVPAVQVVRPLALTSSSKVMPVAMQVPDPVEIINEIEDSPVESGRRDPFAVQAKKRSKW